MDPIYHHHQTSHYHTRATTRVGVIELLVTFCYFHLELYDLLLLHIAVIKIPTITIKVILQEVKVRLMKKFQGY